MKSILFLGGLLILAVLFSGCTFSSDDSGLFGQNFYGTIEKDTPTDYAPQGCGYVLILENNSVFTNNRQILGDVNGGIVKSGWDEFVGKRVLVQGKKHSGAVLIMCPVGIDVRKIEIAK